MNSSIAREQADWMQTLESQCKINTLNYLGIRDLIRYKRTEGLAAKFLAFIKIQGWTDLGVFSPSVSKRRIVHFESFTDWINSEYSEGGLAIAPTQLIILLANAYEYEKSVDACVEVIRLLPSSTLHAAKEQIDDLSTGYACIHGDHWSRLEQAVEETINHPTLSLETKIIGSNVIKPKSGSTQKVLERIQRILVDKSQLESRGLSVTALQEAYTLLIRGMATPTQALRIAGLVSRSKKTSKSVYFVKDSIESAKRVIETIGKEKAAEMARIILSDTDSAEQDFTPPNPE